MKKELLDILACPKCKGKIELSEDQEALLCHVCQLAYPIRDAIPIMIIEEASPLSPEQQST
ncbi:MAG: Trm112 family protein [Candidatus Electrothrix sp. GW3-4]|uniref:Trm112 family protein n=1 Tax=Candidatus Electrothrix sp. GW3-4 TaxID=3126740 RepID=UPI0030CEF8F5